MDRVPDAPALSDIFLWIARERDAAWTAKLAILRACCREDIAHFGRCLREHERHAQELTAITRRLSPWREPPTEPAFVTRDAFVVGSIDDGATLLDAMARLEADRIARYEVERFDRKRGPDEGQATALLEGVLDLHLLDARARLAALQRLRDERREAAA